MYRPILAIGIKAQAVLIILQQRNWERDLIDDYQT